MHYKVMVYAFPNNNCFRRVGSAWGPTEVIDMLDMTSYMNKQEIKSDAINLVYRK